MKFKFGNRNRYKLRRNPDGWFASVMLGLHCITTTPLLVLRLLLSALVISGIMVFIYTTVVISNMLIYPLASLLGYADYDAPEDDCQLPDDEVA